MATAFLARVWTGDIPKIWADGAGHFIQQALDSAHGEFELSDVLRRIEDGRWSLWVVVENKKIVGALTAHVVPYPQMLVCEIVHFATSLPRDQWIPAIGPDSELEKWAKFVGCTHIVFYGRPGFERVKPTEGYDKWYVCMGKKLNHE